MKERFATIKARLWLAFWLLVLLLICQLAALLAPMRAIWAILTANDERVLEIAKGYDLLGNATTNGKSTEFISTRAYRAQLAGNRWGCVLCGLLDKIEKDHCAKSPLILEKVYTPIPTEPYELSTTD
jgi:hypothetical protein